MDPASCFILGNAFVPIDQSEPWTMEFESLLEKGWAHHQQLASTLFVPTGQFLTNVPEEAERQGIAVKRVMEGELIPFIREARQAFKQYERRQRSALHNEAISSTPPRTR